MLDTDRGLTQNNQLKTDVLYSEEYYNNMVFCCLTEKKFVVIKHRTLYIYEGCQEYQEKPDQPVAFFNLMLSDYRLFEKCVIIRNRFATYTLRHESTTILLKLLQAIEKARTTITGQVVYPNKFKCLENGNLSLNIR